MKNGYINPNNIEYASRLNGIVSDGLFNKVIVIPGVGTNSYLLEKFARIHPAKLHILDFDKEETFNE